MSKQEPQQYMRLARIGQTFLVWNGQRYSVRDAPPNVFDAWIRQVVDSIVNVNTEEWEVFQRWQIINAALDGKFLTLHDEGGTHVLHVEGPSEEKMSDRQESEAI